MAISMVRKPSETPNITNIDDIIPFRYAYGNQNGYVISRGAEVSYTVNGNQFTVNSGRLVIQGVESDIDANGIILTIDSVSETRYYAVYLEVNLATNTSNIKVEFDTATYPNITEGDDLTANSSGIARLVLYNFIAQNGVISGVNKVVTSIKHLKDIEVEKSINTKKINGVEIKKDADGVLRVGDLIIPQKKLIMENNNGVTEYVVELNPKRIYEVFVKSSTSSFAKHSVFRVSSNMFTSTTSSVSNVIDNYSSFSPVTGTSTQLGVTMFSLFYGNKNQFHGSVAEVDIKNNSISTTSLYITKIYEVIE